MIIEPLQVQWTFSSIRNARARLRCWRGYGPSRPRQFTAWRGELEKKGQTSVGPPIADALRGEKCELFGEAGRKRLSHKEDVVGRKTNGVHFGTGADLK